MPLRLAGGALVKWLGGGTVLALLLGAGGWLYHEWQTSRLDRALAEARSEVVEMERNRDEWRVAAERWEQEVARLERQSALQRKSVQALEDELAAQQAEYQALSEDLEEVLESQDGPVAPVLRETLGRLP